LHRRTMPSAHLASFEITDAGVMPTCCQFVHERMMHTSRKSRA
jgi:hypothetical protein